MKRPASERKNKYATKLNSDVIGSVYNTTKKSAVDQQKEYFAEAERLEMQVKRIIDGVPSILQHFYIAAAEEMSKVAKRHKSDTAVNEAIIIDEKWKVRGLDPQYLNRIKTLILQEYINICKFDEGLFDICKFG